MKRFKVLIPAAILALSLNGCGGKDKETAAIVSETVTPVEVQEIASENIVKEITYGGKITADHTVAVTPKTSGRVDTILVDVGDKVKKGQVLFTIDKEDLEKQLAQLEASLAISNAGVTSAQNGVNQVEGGQTQTSRLSMENAVKNAQTAVDNAAASLDTAEKSYNDVAKKYEDYKTMLEAGVISQSDFDAIELGYNQAKNGYEQAKLGYNQAQTSLEQAKESLKIFNEQTINDSKTNAQSGLNTALASRETVLLQIKQLKDTIADTNVVSPIDGVISAKNIEVTNMVSAGSEPMEITADSAINVDVNVSERIINKIKAGDTVKVNIGTVSDEPVTGVIKTVNTVADNTGTYPVKVSVENTSGSLKPGMFANVVFTEEFANDTAVVPVNTVIENETEKYVFVVDGNSVKKAVVETGVDNGEMLQLVSGVENGDKVVVSGQSYLSDGDKVKVVTEEE